MHVFSVNILFRKLLSYLFFKCIISIWEDFDLLCNVSKVPFHKPVLSVLVMAVKFAIKEHCYNYRCDTEKGTELQDTVLWITSQIQYKSMEKLKHSLCHAFSTFVWWKNTYNTKYIILVCSLVVLETFMTSYYHLQHSFQKLQHTQCMLKCNSSFSFPWTPGQPSFHFLSQWSYIVKD